MQLQASELGCVRGARRLFGGVHVALSAGQALRVAGPNGSGKSSLLRMLCGLTPPHEGRVQWKGVDIRAHRAQFSADLVYLGHAAAIKDELTAAENVAAASAIASREADAGAVAAALARAGLTHLHDIPCRLLSQGQRKRVALARLYLAPIGGLWVLDEPFSALDADASGALKTMLEAHLGNGGLLVYTTHETVTLHATVLELGRPC